MADKTLSSKLETLHDLSGKVVMVTGASSGLGRKFCTDLAKSGCKIVATAHRVDKLESLCNAINKRSNNVVRAVAVEFDVSANGPSIQASVKKAWDAFGRIDCLINNAGAKGNVSSPLELYNEEGNSSMLTNLTGTWLVAKYVCTYMRDASIGGSIINVSSVSDLDHQELPGGLAYSLKADVITLTKAMAKEMGGYDIRVNAICPGVLNSEITEDIMENEWLRKVVQQTVPFGRFRIVNPALISQAMYLIHDSSKYITGSVFICDGGIALPGVHNFSSL